MTPAEYNYTREDMPENSRKIIAFALLDAFDRFLERPDAREMLDAEAARRKVQANGEKKNE